MSSRWFNAVVVLFWLATMTWLVVVKVLPPLMRGDPPDYRSMYAELQDEPPVGWEMFWSPGAGTGQPLGWAVSEVKRNVHGGVEVASRVHFSNLHLDQMAPAWTRAMIRHAVEPLGELHMDAQSLLQIDPLGRLVSFQSSLKVADLPDVIKVRGDIDGTLLTVTVDSGGMRHVTERRLPEGTLVGDELSPSARMPPLRLGQTWTVPVYSPLRPATSPVEILQASVEETEPIIWNGQAINALVVVYRNDSGLGFLSSREPRGKLWVKQDGTVVKQEVTVFSSRLTFLRMSDEESARRAVSLADGIEELEPVDGADGRETVPQHGAGGLEDVQPATEGLPDE